MKTSLEQAKGSLQEAKQLSINGKYQDAIYLLKQPISVLKEEKRWELYVEGLNQWSYCLCLLGKYSEALEKAELALTNSVKFLGKIHLGTAKSHASSARCYMKKSEYDKAIYIHKKALKIRQLLENQLGIADSYNDLGFCYIYKANYNKSDDLLKKALKIRLDLVGEKCLYVAHIYNNLGICYYFKAIYNKSIEFYINSLRIRHGLLGNKHHTIANSYNNLSLCYCRKMDYNKALYFSNKALKITLNALGENHSFTASTYEGLGICYAYKKQYNKAIFFHEKSLNIRIGLVGENHFDVSRNYTNIAYAYKEIKEYDKALMFNEKSLNIKYSLLRATHPNIADNYINIGSCYQDKLNYEKALDFFFKALSIYNNVYGKKHYARIITLNNICNCYREKEQYIFSINYAQKSLKSNIIGYKNDNVYHNPKIENCLLKETLLSTIQAKAHAFYQYHLTKLNPLNLQASLFTFQVAAIWLNHIRKSIFNEGSKLILAKNTFGVFNNGIKIALLAAQISQTQMAEWENATNQIAAINHDSYPKSKFSYCYTAKDCRAAAFQFSEQSKAILLLAKFNDKKAKKSAGIPQILRDKEHKLKLQLNFIEKQINKECYKPKEKRDEQKILELKSEQFEHKQTYEQLIKTYEVEYPNYYRAKHDTSVVTISQIQQKIAEQTALISYFVGDDRITIFVVTKNDYQVISSPKPTDWEQIIIHFMEAMEEADKKKFIQLGHQLYNLLLHPAIQLITHIEDLVIIPDGSLSKLPFEALCTQTIDTNIKYPDIPYLIMDYDIGYHYSATLWYQGQTEKKQGIQLEDSYIGFAPIHKNESEELVVSPTEPVTVPTSPKKRKRKRFSKDNTRSIQINGTTYSELLYSEQEVTTVQKAFLAKGHKAKIQLHQAASVQNFKQQAGKYKYILIAAHGDYQAEQPELTGILFSPAQKHETRKLTEAEKLELEIGLPTTQSKDTMLYIADAYELNLQATLVVLSCCESGIGEQHKGEGMMGINRAFLYAGAENVVYTLFKVYDDASSKLVSTFFGYILAGKSHKQALRQTKLDMIQKHKEDPYCWAGYVLLGI